MKEKIFALYWGQEIGVNNKGKQIGVYLSSAYHLSYIEVTPLSMITDEHAIEVDFPSASAFNRCLESYGDEFNDLILKHVHIDFLRSKGYALPYMGYSVEQLVTMGIFKLKES